MGTFIPSTPIYGNTARDVSENSGTGAGTPTPRFQQGSMTTEDIAGIESSGTIAQNDVYIRIQTDLLIIGDSIITDRHHASNNNYEADDPQNQIGGIIPSFPLSGWLRHGMERALQQHDTTACHPGEANANFKRDGVYERDLDAGYHEKGACLNHTDHGCLVFDLFGGFEDQPGKFILI